jgi:hypothetical protein
MIILRDSFTKSLLLKKQIESPVAIVINIMFKMYSASKSILVVQFVAESPFANCEIANLISDFDEWKFSRLQTFSQLITKVSET